MHQVLVTQLKLIKYGKLMYKRRCENFINTNCHHLKKLWAMIAKPLEQEKFLILVTVRLDTKDYSRKTLSC